MVNDSDKRLTKNERREQAREQARLARETEKKREKRNRLLIQGGVVLGIIAVLAVVGLVLMQTMKPAGPGPRNMASGGVVFAEDLAVVQGPALAEGTERVAPETDRTKMPLDITIYVDYSCTHCAEFEQAYGSTLENWVGSGAATLQVYPVNILDQGFGGYSTRAANVVSCVVDQSPADGSAFKLHNSLLSAEVYDRVSANGGLGNEDLLEVAELAGVDVNDELKQCVKDARFASFISQNTSVATMNGGILGLAEGAQLVKTSASGQTEYQDADGPQRLQGTPLVVVNGQEWRSDRDGEFEMFLAKLQSELEGKSDSSSSSNGSDGDAAKE
jgi:protein-disulfide isomerase